MLVAAESLSSYTYGDRSRSSAQRAACARVHSWLINRVSAASGTQWACVKRAHAYGWHRARRPVRPVPANGAPLRFPTSGRPRAVAGPLVRDVGAAIRLAPGLANSVASRCPCLVTSLGATPLMVCLRVNPTSRKSHSTKTCSLDEGRAQGGTYPVAHGGTGTAHAVARFLPRLIPPTSSARSPSSSGTSANARTRASRRRAPAGARAADALSWTRSSAWSCSPSLRTGTTRPP
jgi:hypothetical protein